MANEELPISFVQEVGRRLRAIRRQQRLSLEEVEARSAGRWSASAIGAYERGYRNLSLGRLRELAEFYNVPISVLVGEVDLRSADPAPGATGRIVLDLGALERRDDDAARIVARYAHSIAMERGDFNGRVLSLRRDDLRLLAIALQIGDADLYEQLREWRVLDDGTGAAPADIDLTDAADAGLPDAARAPAVDGHSVAPTVAELRGD
jgi:transcriptional regulator with XRE-family HTH domain